MTLHELIMTKLLVKIKLRINIKCLAKGGTMKNNSNKIKMNFFGSANSIIIPVVILALVSWVVWWVYPNISTIILAFKNLSGEFSTVNFSEVWRLITTEGAELRVSIRNTMLFFGVSLIRIPLTTFVVYFIYKRIPGHWVFRVIFYLPAIIPAVALTGAFTNFIAVDGPLGVVCEKIGISISNEGLLNSSTTSIYTVLFYSLWTGICGSLLVTNGAMMRIPTEVLESAQIEGCGVLREFIQLIIPLIWPTMSTLILLCCTSILASGGDTVMLLSTDPVGNNTTTMHYWMFKQVYGNGMGSEDYGVVSAMGLIFTCIMVPFVSLVRKLLGKVEAVEY